MSREEFLRPRLSGGRFDNHGIPLDFLKDLAALEEAIVNTAKWRFREAYGRKRVPRGFTAGITLTLKAVESGSAVPVIDISVNTNQLFPANKECFEWARDSILDLIGVPDQDPKPSDELPPAIYRAFQKIGGGLRKDECMEFTAPNRAAPSSLTQSRRRQLILLSSEVNEIIEETCVRGGVHEADQDKMTFELRPVRGGKVKAAIPEDHFDIIKEAWNGYKDGVKVMIEGLGRFSRNNLLQGFESIRGMYILDPMDVAARLDELRDLKDGWLEGSGLAPSEDGLDWLVQAMEDNYPGNDLPLPFLYPMENGGIQAEWTLGALEATLEIDIEERKAKWHALDMETGHEDESDYDLNEKLEWIRLAEEIKKRREQ